MIGRTRSSAMWRTWSWHNPVLLALALRPVHGRAVADGLYHRNLHCSAVDCGARRVRGLGGMAQPDRRPHAHGIALAHGFPGQRCHDHRCSNRHEPAAHQGEPLNRFAAAFIARPSIDSTIRGGHSCAFRGVARSSIWRMVHGMGWHPGIHHHRGYHCRWHDHHKHCWYPN
jgi:hypothetical protein